MSVFDGLIGNWIQIVDDQNDLTIEDYGYDTGVIDGTTKNHCVLCTAVNKCWFKNEKDKKPARFKSSHSDMLNSITKNVLPGLYHYNCHCKELLIEVNSIDDIQLIVPEGKIQWLFTDKYELIKSFGYKSRDIFTSVIDYCIRQAYYYGNYSIQQHSHFGVKICLYIDLPGVNEKEGKQYNLKSSWMVFPNGKLKCNTYIGGWYK